MASSQLHTKSSIRPANLYPSIFVVFRHSGLVIRWRVLGAYCFASPTIMRPPANPNQHSVLLVTSGYDHTIRFWEALSGICSRTIQHQESQVNRLSISPDKRFLAAAGNQHVRLYDINSAVGTATVVVLDCVLTFLEWSGNHEF